MDMDLRRGGWQPDVPDHRDYLVGHVAVQNLLRRLKPVSSSDALPSRVDWREYCAPPHDQGELPTSCAHACVALVQYFERRSTGRLIRPSRLFLHANAERLLDQPPDHAVSLRAALKAMVHFGAPPEEHWPYSPSTLAKEPPPFVYGFAQWFQKIRFLRLDARQHDGGQTLETVRSFLAAGFPCVLGYPVSTGVTREAEIPFPAVFDGIRTGMAALAVGYDDRVRILSDKGALLIRNSWGTDWGDAGCGWLPYRYVQERLAVDVWTVLRRSWLKSDEFRSPCPIAVTQ
jgi:C1A family cysteine protease